MKVKLDQVKIYTNGDLIFEFKDHKIDENTFVRSIDNNKFTFKNNKLIEINKFMTSIINLIINFIESYSAKMNIYLIEIYNLQRIYLIWFYLAELVVSYHLLYYFNTINDIALQNSLICLGVQNSLLCQGVQKRFFSENKKYYKSNWNSIFFKIDEQIFSIELLEYYFNKFWKIVSPQIEEGCHIFILMKFQFEDGYYHNIGKLIKIDDKNKKSFITQIKTQMEILGDYYNNTNITRIIFNYGFKKGPITEKISKSEIKLLNHKDLKIPISIIPSDYGKIFNKIENDGKTIYMIYDSLARIISIDETEKTNLVTYYKNGEMILQFEDIKQSKSKFIRKLTRKTLLFENGNKTLEISQLNTPCISKIQKDNKEINKFITLDIETYGESELIPYLISFYDGVKTYSFYLSDYNNSIDSMMEACFKKLFVRKYNFYQVYVHNLTKFDIVFLLKYLIKFTSVRPLIHRGRIIQITAHFGEKNKYYVTFKDSYLILLSSLDKLCKSFSVENPKSIFPHKFVNENNLDYIGEVPNIDNFF